jgi:2-oxoisovalerate dehydrogenase E1 component alpha subunit
MQTLKVDGNDALAVYESVRFARNHFIKYKEPFFIEFMTYRLGDHSTCDNSNLYRPESEKDIWGRKNNPILRLFVDLKSRTSRTQPIKMMRVIVRVSGSRSLTCSENVLRIRN